jgi:hypothetical protein
VVKGNLGIEFVAQQLTSYGGLEMSTRYFRTMNVMSRLRRALAAVPSDYGSARLALLVLGPFYVGAHRLEPVRYLASDPLLGRFCSLARLPRGALSHPYWQRGPNECG